MSSLLVVDRASMRFGGLTAVNAVDMNVEKGEIHLLIGPNGAGKTTLFNMVSGLYIPSDGKILFDGEDISKYPSHTVCRKGISRTFQNILIFDDLPVRENIMVGCHCNTNTNPISEILRTPKMKGEEKACRERSNKILEFVGLQDYADVKAGSLPYGRKRILEIARALGPRPKLLMLDEPAAGMNPIETDELINLIYKIRDSGVTLLIVEHNMRMAMKIANRVTVLDHGVKIADGYPQDVMHNPQVIEAYLGKEVAS